jgi:DUF1365 family protein
VRAARPLLGVGEVRHRRLRPRAHAFAYRTAFLMLPLRSLSLIPCDALSRNRFGALSFHDRDHGDGRGDCLAWIEEVLQREGIVADGEIWLQCMPRVLGYAFKPVSFWYCHRSDDSLAAIVVEVNNTFGERHCYLLCDPPPAFGHELSAKKVFHVSPFCALEGGYRFRFMRQGNARTVARIVHHDDEGPLLVTSISGRLHPLTPASRRAVFLRMPLMSFAVIARIHWRALRLWLMRIPVVGKPAAPDSFITR